VATLGLIIQLLYRGPLQSHTMLLSQLVNFLQPIILSAPLHMQFAHPLRCRLKHGLHRMNAINPIHKFLLLLTLVTRPTQSPIAHCTGFGQNPNQIV
jgi:hypothetical protein